MRKNMILLCAVLVMTTGCAGLTGPSDYTEFAGAYKEFSKAKVKQTKACAPDLSMVGTEAETAYAQAASMLCVALVSQQRFELAKPTTGMDVAGKLVDQVPFVAATGFMYRLGKIGIENAGQVNIAEGATVSNSLNPAEVHNTGSGTQTYSGTGEPTVVEVEPFVVE